MHSWIWLITFPFFFFFPSSTFCLIRIQVRSTYCEWLIGLKFCTIYKDCIFYISKYVVIFLLLSFISLERIILNHIYVRLKRQLHTSFIWMDECLKMYVSNLKDQKESWLWQQSWIFSLIIGHCVLGHIWWMSLLEGITGEQESVTCNVLSRINLRATC